MSWLRKMARTEMDRLSTNIERLEALRSKVHDLGYFAIASNSGGHEALTGLVEEHIVRGRPKILEKMRSALTGENNQKVALDAPTRFQAIMVEAEELIKSDMNKEVRELKKLRREEDERNES